MRWITGQMGDQTLLPFGIVALNQPIIHKSVEVGAHMIRSAMVDQTGAEHETHETIHPPQVLGTHGA